jgi:hypothetical protein
MTAYPLADEWQTFLGPQRRSMVLLGKEDSDGFEEGVQIFGIGRGY